MDGDQPILLFSSQNGQIRRWDGSGLTWVGGILGTDSGSGTVYSIRAHDFEGQTDIFAGGSFYIDSYEGYPEELKRSFNVAQLDGNSWEGLGSGLNGGPVNRLEILDSTLIALGDFSDSDGVLIDRTASWDEEENRWQPLGSSSPGHGIFDGMVKTSITMDNGARQVLVVAGSFSRAGQVAAKNIALWDGVSWSSLGSGIISRSVNDLVIFDDGTGSEPALVAGTEEGQVLLWDGAEWHQLGQGMDRSIEALEVFDFGNGAAVVAGGAFKTADGKSAEGLALWDGFGWSSLSSDMDGEVLALEVYDLGLGEGPVLVAGRTFSELDGISANRIAQWDGMRWSGLGPGFSRTVRAIETYTQESGPTLIAAGDFSTRNGDPGDSVAQWDGLAWSSLGAGIGGPIVEEDGIPRIPGVYSLHSTNSGGDPVIMAGGKFIEAGGNPAMNIARWNGSSWSPIGDGTDSAVQTLTAFQDGNQTKIFAGGTFHVANGKPSSRVAFFSCPPTPSLIIPESIPGAADQRIDVPVILTNDGAGLGGTSFSVDYDESCLSLSNEDTNGDGLPDSVTYHGPAGYQVFADHDETDTDGELDVSIFGSTSVAPLPSGKLISIDFSAACNPSADNPRTAHMLFSHSPAPTFGDLSARDISGSAFDGSVLIHGGLRGDCNSGGSLGVADLTAGELEIFDTDGTFWADTPGGSFSGNPLGCDANADTAVDAGDLSCIHRLIFGESCSTSSNTREPSLAQAGHLQLGPWEARIENNRIVSILKLESFNKNLNSLVLSLDLDTSLFTFDPSDNNSDGIPDSVKLPVYQPSNTKVYWNPMDSDGEIDLVLTNPGISSSAAFPEQLTVEIELEILNPTAFSEGTYIVQPLQFSMAPAPSLGDVLGRSQTPTFSIPIVGLFSDSFESGGIGAWSSSLP